MSRPIRVTVAAVLAAALALPLLGSTPAARRPWPRPSRPGDVTFSRPERHVPRLGLGER